MDENTQKEETCQQQKKEEKGPKKTEMNGNYDINPEFELEEQQNPSVKSRYYDARVERRKKGRYLKDVTHINKESSRMRCDRNPYPFIHRNLKTRNSIGFQDSENLRICVLSETNPAVIIVVVMTKMVMKGRGR